MDISEEDELLVLASFDPLAGMAGIDREKLSVLAAGMKDEKQAALAASIHKLRTGFAPEGAPGSQGGEVDKEAIDSAAAVLAQKFKSTQDLDPVLCPKCGEEFYVEK